jgi:hypothetical protein
MLPMKLSGFNRDIWSETGLAGEAQKNISNTASSIEEDVNYVSSSIESAGSAVYNAF